jgi:hypothetical protein
MRSGIGESLPTGYRNVGVRFDDPAPRWCFVDGSEYYLRLVANHLGACVLIDTTGELPFLGTRGTLSIEYCAPSACPQMFVVPDTARMRDRIDAFLAGRPRETQEVDTRAASAPYVPGAPRDPADFLRFPVARAECNVSGLLRAGQWEDSAGLEAARMLLLKRFDLKLGLWDLALNPVLRSTVLDPLPVRRAPKEPVQAPPHARKRAGREAEKATARREAVQRAVGEVTAALHQELASLGWSVNDRGRLCLPLTEPLSNWPGAPEHPLVLLTIEVNKISVRVLVWHWFYNDLNINVFIEKRRKAFEAVALLPPSTKCRSSMPLWTASTGWGDADADWSSTAKTIAEHTKRWVGLLADFVASCRKVRRARFIGIGDYRVNFPRVFGEMNKQKIGYNIKVWLQRCMGEPGELLINRWTWSPTSAHRIVTRLAQKLSLDDNWEIVTNLN